MCGFLGVFSRSPLSGQEKRFELFSDRLKHRGNTSRGSKLFPKAALYHHRLAFRDLNAGQQPMTDSHDSATIIFNGELYDFQNLRNKLSQSYSFQSRSDTEVILASYLSGNQDYLQTFDGEFAFVIYEHESEKIIASRDAFGVKPLYWSAEAVSPKILNCSDRYEFFVKGEISFASEIKGLPLQLHWNQRGLTRSFSSLFEEMGTAFEGVYSLASGSLFTATPERNGWKVVIERKQKLERKPAHSSKLDFAASAQDLKKILKFTVRNKLDSDVPLGAYLSGGVDSRIAAFEMAQLQHEIETFTVGFEGADYDESAEVKKFLGNFPNLRGRVLRTNNDALAYAYPHAIYASELVQPYTNGAAKWWLSRFARKFVQGVLTGDGADEIFCGYPSYRYLAWWNFYSRTKSSSRAQLYERRVLGKNEKIWEKGISSQSNGEDLSRSIQTLGWAHPMFAHVDQIGEWLLGNSWQTFLADEKSSIATYVNPELSPQSQWQNYFLKTHFPTHVLNWVGDRMEMANTLEGRPIFLSKKIFQFVETLPDNFLVRGLRDKAILRKAYERELQSFAFTPKKQFNAPFLFESELGKDFLSENNLKSQNLIDPKLIERIRTLRLNTKDPLQKSFADIFLQNSLVTLMLDLYLVRNQPPERKLDFEEQFLEQNIERL